MPIYAVQYDNTHYSAALEPQKLYCAATDIVRRLSKFLNNTKAMPILVYQGMSGVSHATMLAHCLTEQNIACGMIYVRKANEQCHGSEIECNIPASKTYAFYFVDDFVETAETFIRCNEMMMEQFNLKHKSLGTILFEPNADGKYPHIANPKHIIKSIK